MTDTGAVTTFAAGNDGEMLRLHPQDTICFNKYQNEYVGFVDIVNCSDTSVTYKIKTTSPEKFRVKPSTGLMAAGAMQRIDVILQQSQSTPSGLSLMKDKFLVMCMEVPDNFAGTPTAITEFWKNTPSSSAQIEQHRLKCAVGEMAANGGDGWHDKNARMASGSGHIDANDIPAQIQQQLCRSLGQQAEINQKLQSQLKFTQTLQWILLVAYIILSIGIVYVLKREINEQTAGFFDKDCANSQPHQEL